ncbi:major facilitator superfamily domain-containing protein [Aspergillus cavernicola]|uniref:Major facilitator superfamily domain-containing protein n=1 Tax=Aspergillus cavernicola TaxID=176166 RepID=A0ABR4I7F7_9EURO
MDTVKADSPLDGGPVVLTQSDPPLPKPIATNGEFDEIDALLADYVPNTELEKRLVKKVDMYMMPTLWLMCVLAYVDRNNIGNARAAGMGDDLDLTSSRYAMLITVFFIAYVILEVPSNLILARVRPSWYLAAIMIAWGVVVAAMSQVKTYEGILVARFFLGLIEAGFMPGVMFVMSCWYKKEEIGKRFSIFFTALCIAGAVSGLLSGAIISGLDDSAGMTGWRWLFLLEGVITICVAFICKFILLDYPATSSRLTPEERQMAVVRILYDKKQISQPTKRLNPLQALHAAVVDVRTYFFTVLYLLDNGVATISYFIPTVVGDMGYSGVTAQWMTVPIWIVATIFLVLISLSSDRTQDRQWHIVFGLTLATIAGIIIVTVKHTATRYAFICFYVSGVYCAFPLILIWTSETIPLPLEKRAVAIALVNGLGDLAALYGSRMWPTSDAPDYKPGFVAMIVMCAAGGVIAACMPFLLRFLPQFTTKAERELTAIEGRPAEAA